MDIISLIITVALSALMLYLAIRLPLAIMRNLKAGHRFRESLAGALDQLRLSRMLGFLGVDKDAYLHKQDALQIRQHMQKCDDCDAKSQCDDVLNSSQTADVDSLGFCANIEDLKQIRGNR